MGDDEAKSASQQADAILNGSAALPAFTELKSLVRDLKGGFQFQRARKLIARARGTVAPDDERWLVQQLALCTYKDEELIPAVRFREALDLLSQIGLRQPTMTDPETLGLGGAVYKRTFEFGGQLDDLHESLALYSAGWERRAADNRYSQERPYCGVNAAYVLDVLASRADVIARRTGTTTEPAKELARRAKQIRTEILEYKRRYLDGPERPQQGYWDAVTWAEAHFGLGEYAEAKRYLAAAATLVPSDWKWKWEWEQQTTFKQFVSLARLQRVMPPAESSDPATWHPAWLALHAFLGDDTEQALSCYRGKVGLALSGGGFRASLFHLGVLARLAEMDVLRSVEVLSTVSGGSIVGAHYYLEVQHLLETRADRDIRRRDYIRIVRRVQRHFFRGVRRNLRTRALSSLWHNLRMVLSKSYSRSNRLGELYESELYRYVRDGKQDGERRMQQLLITPQGSDPATPFKPDFSNWRRRAKVPVLLLNATSLNSGHSWQFTARWMGEPPGLIEGSVDANVRYRRLWYEQAPTADLRNYRLGYAVAASAGVPGLFEPLPLHGLYPGRTVLLVDGGVHDNQGVEGLLDESTTLVLCSDASGQMDDLERPSDTLIGVPLRSNSILQDRVREAEYQDLQARVDDHALEGLFFIHLKNGLAVAPLDWIGCKDPTPVPERTVSTTDYGVDYEVQRQLAAIRTDLDSFTEVEAYALMASGYLMTTSEFYNLQRAHERRGMPGTWGTFDIVARPGRWPFQPLTGLLRQPAATADCRRHDLGAQLAAGSGLFFKVWRLVPTLRRISWAGGAALAFGISSLLCATWKSPLPMPNVTVGKAAVALGLLAAAALFPLLKWLDPRSAARGYLGKVVVALAGWIASNVHMHVFDPLYLSRGRLRRLLRLQ